MTTEDKTTRVARLEEAIRRRREAAHERTTRVPARPADQEPRLGAMQLGIWLLQQLDPTSPAYHLASAFRISGSLDLEALERSVNEVVRHHRILRSTFRADGDGVRQVIHPSLRVPLERLTAARGELVSAAALAARRPFDLEAGPLLRLLCVEAADGPERLLVLVVHHLLADERSLDLLWREVERRYAGPAADETSGAQYDDYAHWERQRADEQRSTDLEFWRRRLDPQPQELALPFETPRSDTALGAGRLLSRPFPAALQNRVRSVAAAVGTTPFAVLAFTFRLLLHRYTEGRDIAFATPVSVRSHPDVAEMIGYFLNPLIVYTPIDEARSVEQALREFSREARAGIDRLSVPFHQLVEALAPARSEDRHPLFQTMFVYQETTPPPRLGATELEPVVLDLGASKFDLTLFATVGSERAELALEYRTDRFASVWMERLLRHYVTLLEGLEDGLGQPSSELPMLPPQERDELERLSWGAPVDPPGRKLLPQRILRRAADSPHAPAVVGAGAKDWSYDDLRQTALRIAGALRQQGVGPTDRVGLSLDRSPLMIAGVLGIQWTGAAYVPVDPADPAARVRTVLEDAEVKALVTRRELESRTADFGLPTVFADEVEAGDLDIADALSTLRPEHPAYVLYTSGSTGEPKGVVVSHANLAASTDARPPVYGTRPERFLLLPSVAFDSSVAGIFWTLSEGGTLVLPTDDEITSPGRLARLVSERRVTTLLCVPSLYGRLLEAAGELEGLETVIVAGEACPRWLVESHFRLLPGSRLFNEYGPTEATVWATSHAFDPSDPTEEVPIGRPIPGVRLDVLDSLGRPVPAGVPGEGWITGPTVADGYWRRPDLTAERFVRRTAGGEEDQRTFRTGDRLAWTPDGRLLFLGRLDDQIKLRGFRIEPGEIETALQRIEGVREAAVVVRDAAQLVAFVAADARLPDWHEALSAELPTFMVPQRLIELEDLPRTPNGKIDRRRLEAIDIEPDTPADDRVPPRTDRERALVSIWEGLLGRAGIGVTDNFFRIGGHSLLAVEMALLAERDLGLPVEPIDVFQRPTIRGLLSQIDETSPDSAPPYTHLFPIQPGGRGAPFVFCVPHFFTEMAADRFRGERPVYGLRGVSLRQEGNRGRWRRMEDLGVELVDEIVRRFPQQPVFMAGYSFGASMAVEATRQMEARGIPVERLFIIAPMPLDFLRLGPFRLQVDALRRPVEELSFAQALRQIARHSHPLTQRFYQRFRRFVVTQPWRRLLCLAGRARKLTGSELTPRILHADVRVERFRLHAAYRPGLVETPTVIFNAGEPATDAATTWRPVFRGPLAVHEIPDPHLGDTSAEAARQAVFEHLADLRATQDTQ